MISLCISIVLFCFQWLFKSYISKLLWTDFSITLPITSRISELITSRITFSELSYATCTRINAVGTTVQFAFAVPVGGLIPYLKRSDGSFPQASCNWVLFPTVNRELKRRVPVEFSDRSKVEKLSVTIYPYGNHTYACTLWGNNYKQMLHSVSNRKITKQSGSYYKWCSF